MAEDIFNRQLMRKITPRLIKAAIWGFIMGGEALLISLIPSFEQLERVLPVKGAYFSGLMVLFISIEVAMQLLSGTVLRYVLGTLRATLATVALITASKGGVLTQDIAFGPGSIRVIFEFKAIISILLLLSLLVIFKNIMYAIDFLYEKSEEPTRPEEIP